MPSVGEHQVRKIVHIDMDCFYAAVEIRDRPDLSHRPLAVGGRPEGRGVIAACNYVARRFDVHSALSSREAVRRCPDLIILPPRFSLYRQVSKQIRHIFSRYTAFIEPLSLDEAYLDLSESQHFSGLATQTARQIRQDIFDTTGLTASAGIANSKFLAKIASDWHKPNGQFTIQPHEVKNFILKLPVKKIPGVGRVTQKKMAKMDLKTCGDLQELSLEQMSFYFGRFGERLYDLARGIDHSKVKPHRQRKSISVETTFSRDISQWSEVKKEIIKLYTELSLRLKKAQLTDNEVKSLTIKFKLNNFSNHTKERGGQKPTMENFLQLGEDHYYQTNQPLRLVGIGCKLKIPKKTPKARHQLNLFSNL